MKMIPRSSFQTLFSTPYKLRYCRTLSHLKKNEEKRRNQKTNNHYEKFTSKSALLVVATTSLFGYYYLINEKHQTYAYAAKKKVDTPDPFRGCGKHKPGNWRPDLPVYTRKDVEKHDSIETGIWTSYKEGVYDLTSYIEEHPGGKLILLAAGGPIEAFWVKYGFHEEVPFILERFEKLRIGNLCKDDQVKMSDYPDPFLNEPKRDTNLRPATIRPYNGTVRLDYLADNFITPVKWWYVRNHLPVPDIDAEKHEISLEVEGTDKKLTFTMDDIKRMPKACIMITLTCSGNQRDVMMQATGEPKAVNWGSGAMSNAIWVGVRLCDLLKQVGITDEDFQNYKHVQFEGVDQEANHVPYNVSIPIWKGVDKRGDVLVAYEMNGEPLSRDHGYPIRIVCPGHTGARSCKWLKRIVVSENEATGHYQAIDYKSFSPTARWDNADYSKAPAVQAIPVYSMICKPLDNDVVKVVDGYINVKGYANAGGGNKIIRINVSADKGKTWMDATLDYQDNKRDYPNNWAWTLWHCKIPVQNDQNEVEIWCKAVDTSNNTQPENFDHIFNFKGVICNAYHKIKLKLIQSGADTKTCNKKLKN